MAINRRSLCAGQDVNTAFYLASQFIDGLVFCVSFYDLEKDLLTYGKYIPIIGSCKPLNIRVANVHWLVQTKESFAQTCNE